MRTRTTLESGFLLGLVATAVTISAPARAQEAGASLSLSTESGADAKTSGPDVDDERLRPESNLVEVGVFGGLIFPSSKHQLKSSDSAHQPFAKIAPELGLRVGYFPLAFLGAEIEGAVMPTKTRSDDEPAGLWAARAHVVGQLPYWRIAPFALVGGGRMGAGSNAMGSDGDPLIHFGVGAKYALDDLVGVRLDVRDNLTQKASSSNGTLTHHPEVLASLTFTLNRSRPVSKLPPDTDGDKFIDAEDECPKEAGMAPNGCPVRDRDGDGVADGADKCLDQPGPTPTGCPILDVDGDGVMDDVDRCPKIVGVPAEGCPDPDADKDGIALPADKCPNELETVNQYEDADGCPDQLPEKLKQFTGVIEGIEFDTGSARVRPISNKLLDDAAKVLLEYPALRMLISGHTDNVGTPEKNATLSQGRADSVKKYLVGKGVDAARIETRGAGSSEPIVDNATEAGRQKNRRIEFKLVQ